MPNFENHEVIQKMFSMIEKFSSRLGRDRKTTKYNKLENIKPENNKLNLRAKKILKKSTI